MKDELRELGIPVGFEECPPDVECPLGFDIVRAPAKGSLDFVCLSAVAIGKYTHWWCARTQPCDGDECAKCLQGSSRRWHSWVAVYSERASRTFILEVPAGAAKYLSDYRSKHGTLRGCGLKVLRNNGKANGKVCIGVAKSKHDNSLLPPCPDLQAMLERMWSSRLGDQDATTATRLHVVAQQGDARRSG